MNARRSGEGAEEAKAGTMASSSGSEMAAPTPRRMVRRLRPAPSRSRLGKSVRRDRLAGIGYDLFDELSERFVPGNGWNRCLAPEREGSELNGQTTRESVLIF